MNRKEIDHSRWCCAFNMDIETRQRIEVTVHHLVNLLVDGNYKAIEELSNGVRLKAEEIENAVLDYGARLTSPPEDAYSMVDVVPIDGCFPQEYSIRFRLYTAEEGLSDLEMRATLVDGGDSRLMNVEFDDVIVA